MTDEEFVLPDPLGRLTRHQVQTALDVFDLGTLRSVTSSSTGGYNYNQTAFLETTAGCFVFKGAPQEPWQFPKEQCFAELISTETVLSVPWPVHYYPKPDVFPWPFVIMPRLTGSDLTVLLPENERGPESWTQVARAQAMALVALQTATFDSAGDYSFRAGSIEPFSQSYSDWVVDQISTRLAATPSLTPADVLWILERVEGWSSFLVPPERNVIVHGDFGYWNMMWERSEAGLQVTGVYDLVTAAIGDNLADVAYQYTTYVNIDRSVADTFVEAYQELRGGYEESVAERFHLYVVYERLNLRDFAYRNGADWIDWTTPVPEWLVSYFPTNSPFRGV
jgi:aminoglycoside phosphotransferase (APT) family kinase protein